jgi:hypothetical protein
MFFTLGKSEVQSPSEVLVEITNIFFSSFTFVFQIHVHIHFAAGVSIEEAQEAAKLCVANALQIAYSHLGREIDFSLHFSFCSFHNSLFQALSLVFKRLSALEVSSVPRPISLSSRE